MMKKNKKECITYKLYVKMHIKNIIKNANSLSEKAETAIKLLKRLKNDIDNNVILKFYWQEMIAFRNNLNHCKRRFNILLNSLLQLSNEMVIINYKPIKRL